MGLWGYRLFESEMQLDCISAIASEVGYELYEDDPIKIKQCREKLDTGLGATLLANQRSQESEMFSTLGTLHGPKFDTILVAAYMMHFGAKIPEDDVKHMKKTVFALDSRNVAGLDLRSPAQAQIIGALNHYQAGQPRSFSDPSCFFCGKMSCDMGGRKLKRCSGCDKDTSPSWYCNRKCQKANWLTHKRICGAWKGSSSFSMMNV